MAEAEGRAGAWPRPLAARLPHMRLSLPAGCHWLLLLLLLLLLLFCGADVQQHICQLRAIEEV